MRVRSTRISPISIIIKIMIETQDLSKHFNGFVAVDGIDLQVPAGQVMALLGPNGAGKTTTVRMLTSVLRPTRGKALVAGFDILRQPEQVRRSVGVLTEQHGLYGRMPADEYLEFFGRLYGMPAEQRRARAAELLEQYGLTADRKRRTGEYSKGMRQKLALARALFHDPPVLLLDEPTSAMDPESARLVRDAIHSLRSANRAIIICTHNLAEAEDLADQIAIIRRGRIIAGGTVEALKQRLLGAPEFEVCLGVPLSETADLLPASVTPTGRGADWLRYRSVNPKVDNPAVVQAMVQRGLPVLSLAEVPRSLENVYLQAINATNGTEGSDVG
jgi:ABC-2 type transport system ATP-binding protein